MSKTSKLAILCSILALLVTQVQAYPGAGAQQAGSPATASQATTIKGKVVETMDGGGYTYVCIESNGQNHWAAMPPTEVKVGETVEIAPGMVMNNFKSNTLDRTFESLIFTSGLVGK